LFLDQGGVSEEDRFTEIIEKKMNQVEVLNLGVPGYSLDQEYLLLRDEVFQYGTTRPASNPKKILDQDPTPSPGGRSNTRKCTYVPTRT